MKYYVTTGDFKRVEITAKNHKEAFTVFLAKYSPDALGKLVSISTTPKESSSKDLYFSTVNLLEEVGMFNVR